MKPVCSFVKTFFKTFKSSCGIALVVLGLALSCAPSARAGGAVSVCDEATFRAALAGGGLVTFDCSGTITLAATITISANTTIDGSEENVTISGGNAVKIFDVPIGVKVHLLKLTIANGFSLVDDGGISNEGTLTVTNSTFSGNDCRLARGICASGIGNEGTLTVTNSTFPGNGVTAIANFGTLTVTNSTFSGNGGFAGGGIFNVGTLTVTNSTFSGNRVGGGGGGGIYNGGTLTLTNSTFSSNASGGGGGGGIRNDGTLTVTNSTFSGNSAPGNGGAIENSAGTLTITNSTLSGNSAGSGGGIYNAGSATLNNTIIANTSSGGNCAGTVTDGGGNLVMGVPGAPDATSACDTIPASPDPQLGPLQNNGGPSQTLALGAGSPAIGKAVEANCPTSDQRGFPRPFASQLAIILGQPATCSIGAYEPGTLFKSFYINNDYTVLNATSFSVVGTFTLGTDPDGGIVSANAVEFRFGTFSIVIPGASFTGASTFTYVNSAGTFRMTISSLGVQRYAFSGSGSAPLTGTVRPVLVQLTVGDDGGTTHTPVEAGDM
jgi:hypothetical protein